MVAGINDSLCFLLVVSYDQEMTVVVVLRENRILSMPKKKFTDMTGTLIWLQNETVLTEYLLLFKIYYVSIVDSSTDVHVHVTEAEHRYCS